MSLFPSVGFGVELGCGQIAVLVVSVFEVDPEVNGVYMQRWATVPLHLGSELITKL